MSLVSATPGKLLSTTLALPQAAKAVVSWTIRDYAGNLVIRGQCAPAGTTVIISCVLPSTCKVPPDGSKYVISATDGFAAVSEYFSVISPTALQVSHGIEVAYMQNRVFQDTLILPYEATNISIQVVLDNSVVAIASTPVTTVVSQYGDSFAYPFDFSTTTAGLAASPVGSVNTYTSSAFGTGTIIWDYTPCDDIEANQEMHPLYTITPYSATFLNAIRKLIDKARIGDVNQYLAYTTSDLCHGLVRGCDYVMQSPPVAGGWPLDMMPIMLRDYIVKAGALDMLRAQHQAEGMSQIDMQGLGVQLQVDRTAVLDNLINQLTSDLAGLVQAKNEWLNQGAPLGSTMAGGKRVIGVLGLTRGAYSTYPMIPLPVIMGGYSFLGGMGYGPLY